MEVYAKENATFTLIRQFHLQSHEVYTEDTDNATGDNHLIGCMGNLVVVSKPIAVFSGLCVSVCGG